MKPRNVTVRAVIVDDDGKLFCVRLKAHQSEKHGDFWCLPGGKLDLGEPLVDGLRREMVEETAVEPHISNLLYIQQFRDSVGPEHLEFMFHVTNTDDYKNKVDLAAASHAEEEIAEAAFIDPGANYVLPKFLTTEDLPVRIKNQEPVKIFSHEL